MTPAEFEGKVDDLRVAGIVTIAERLADLGQAFAALTETGRTFDPMLRKLARLGRRPSKGWRRHVRRMKACDRRFSVVF